MRPQEVHELVAKLARWEWATKDRLGAAGWTPSQLRTLLREFNDQMRGILMLLHEGKMEDVTRRLEVMVRIASTIDGREDAGRVLQ